MMIRRQENVTVRHRVLLVANASPFWRSIPNLFSDSPFQSPFHTFAIYLWNSIFADWKIRAFHRETPALARRHGRIQKYCNRNAYACEQA